MNDRVRLTVDYTRISEDPTGEAAGPARQHQDNVLLAQAKGLTIARTYSDPDISALDERKIRPDFERLVKDVATGQIAMIIVWHMDRLCVRVDDLARLLKAGKDHKVTIAAVHGISIDMSDPTGVAVATILVAIAEMERRHKGIRQRRANEQRAAQGLPFGGGLRPFGYQPDRLTVNEDEAEFIREAARSILAGGSVSGVVRAWNEAGFPTPVRAGRWTLGSLSGVLRSPRIAGLVERHGKLVGEAAWPAILDRDTFEQLQTRLRNGGHGDGVRKQHLLSGLLYCECGAPMVAGGQAGAYRCDRQRNGCGKVSRRFDRIEPHIVSEWVAEMRRRTGSDVFTFHEGYDAQDTERDRWVIERDEVLRRIDKTRTEYATGKISDEDTFPMLETLRARLAEIDRQLEKTERPPMVEGSPLLGIDVETDWRSAFDFVGQRDGVAGQRELLRRYIDQVTVGPISKPGSRKFDASTVDIDWR